MAELFKDPYFNLWHGSRSNGTEILSVVVKKLGRKSWTVTTVDSAGQFDTKQKAFKAAGNYLDNGTSPYDDPHNLARLWHDN